MDCSFSDSADEGFYLQRACWTSSPARSLIITGTDSSQVKTLAEYCKPHYGSEFNLRGSIKNESKSGAAPSTVVKRENNAALI